LPLDSVAQRAGNYLRIVLTLDEVVVRAFHHRLHAQFVHLRLDEHHDRHAGSFFKYPGDGLLRGSIRQIWVEQHAVDLVLRKTNAGSGKIVRNLYLKAEALHLRQQVGEKSGIGWVGFDKQDMKGRGELTHCLYPRETTHCRVAVGGADAGMVFEDYTITQKGAPRAGNFTKGRLYCLPLCRL